MVITKLSGLTRRNIPPIASEMVEEYVLVLKAENMRFRSRIRLTYRNTWQRCQSSRCYLQTWEGGKVQPWIQLLDQI
jgi:hypothetical protein